VRLLYRIETRCQHPVDFIFHPEKPEPFNQPRRADHYNRSAPLVNTLVNFLAVVPEALPRRRPERTAYSTDLFPIVKQLF
ncbi:hypothetical protein, partial [Methylobacter luteus]|uniref:hypothetical protein n=1 Tax=Methylobacter luteus TaxID=415 RepID=UPI001E4D4FEB